MKKAEIRFPPLETRTCWIGSYGGHSEIVVVFSEKPKKVSKDHLFKKKRYYCELLNRDIIAGKFDKDEFNQWFGTNIQPKEIEITQVFQYQLTAIWLNWFQIAVN